MKSYDILCYTETNLEYRWFEVEAENEEAAVKKLYKLIPEVEEIIEIREVKE